LAPSSAVGLRSGLAEQQIRHDQHDLGHEDEEQRDQADRDQEGDRFAGGRTSDFDFPGVKTAWSAVFVSWCVKKAGATGKEFAFAAAHAKFVKAAIGNALKGVGVFRGLQIDQYAPKVGDIVQNNRSGNKFTYDFARTHSAYESHSAIVVEVGVDHDGHYVMTIGGNESDSPKADPSE
jgi:hypothetical protein